MVAENISNLNKNITMAQTGTIPSLIQQLTIHQELSLQDKFPKKYSLNIEAKIYMTNHSCYTGDRRDRPEKPPQRYTAPRSMTIAVGILGADFAVIAADTEVSYGDWTKISKTKVFPVVDGTTGSDGIMEVTGAGDTNYIEAFTHEELTREFLCTEDLDHFEAGFKSKLVNFTRDHSVPQEAISLIVAAQRCGEMRMWTSYGSTVRSCLGSIAVGIGESYARDILLSGVNADVTTAQLVATFAINRAKGFVQRCGHFGAFQK